MTDQTDRIKQMAQEAGLAWLDDEGAAFTASRDCVDITDDLAKFAALVAEDVVRLYYEHAGDNMQIPGYDAIRARYAIAKPPEAG